MTGLVAIAMDNSIGSLTIGNVPGGVTPDSESLEPDVVEELLAATVVETVVVAVESLVVQAVNMEMIKLTTKIQAITFFFISTLHSIF